MKKTLDYSSGGLEKREHKRFSVDGVIELTVNNSTIIGQFVDVSYGGLLFYSPVMISRGLNIEVLIHSTNLAPLLLRCKVVRCSPQDASQGTLGFSVGLQFAEPDKTFWNAIQLWLDTSVQSDYKAIFSDSLLPLRRMLLIGSVDVGGLKVPIILKKMNMTQLILSSSLEVPLPDRFKLLVTSGRSQEEIGVEVIKAKMLPKKLGVFVSMILGRISSALLDKQISQYDVLLSAQEKMLLGIASVDTLKSILKASAHEIANLLQRHDIRVVPFYFPQPWENSEKWAGLRFSEKEIMWIALRVKLAYAAWFGETQKISTEDNKQITKLLGDIKLECRSITTQKTAANFENAEQLNSHISETLSLEWNRLRVGYDFTKEASIMKMMEDTSSSYEIPLTDHSKHRFRQKGVLAIGVLTLLSSIIINIFPWLKDQTMRGKARELSQILHIENYYVDDGYFVGILDNTSTWLSLSMEEKVTLGQQQLTSTVEKNFKGLRLLDANKNYLADTIYYGDQRMWYIPERP